jgi:hypothetical protein
MSTDLKDKERLSLPFEELNNPWTFVRTEDHIIGYKIVIMNVSVITEKDGSKVINEQTKKPMFETARNVVARVFDEEEYQAFLEMQKRNLLK